MDPNAVCLNDMHRLNLLSITPESTNMYAAFDHLAGYSSAYYTYMWDKVIAEDFFLQFDQKDLFSGDTPARYRHLVLEPGGSESASDLVKNFLGRPQNTVAFQHWMDEEFRSPSTSPSPSAQ